MKKAHAAKGRWPTRSTSPTAPGARAHMSAVAAATIMLNAGIEPILQLVCRDRNRIGLQSDLMGASALGIRNLLILGGDKPTAGDQPEASRCSISIEVAVDDRQGHRRRRAADRHEGPQPASVLHRCGRCAG